MQVRSVLMVHRGVVVGRPGILIGYVCRLSADPDQSLVALGCYFNADCVSEGYWYYCNDPSYPDQSRKTQSEP
jgi:hypothetical protein